jgi:SPP1 gp7 family putative phage head morphogenesis protein
MKITLARRIEDTYRRQLEAIINRFLRVPPSSTMGHLQGALDDFEKAASFLEEYAALASGNMVTGVAASTARNWRQAVRDSGRGQELHDLLIHEMKGPVGNKLRAIVRDNAKLVGSIPRETRHMMTDEIAAMQQAGQRPETIARYMTQRMPRLAINKARLIARTETSKTATAITRARSDELGLRYYIWHTGGDARVRYSHRKMDGVLVPWNDPPSPEALVGIASKLGHYHAGDCPNCRCIPLPVLSSDDVQWPTKVYRGGVIRMMSRREFESGYKIARVA